MQNDEKTKKTTRNDENVIIIDVVFLRGVVSSFWVKISLFRVACGVFSSFGVAFFRYFVILHGVFSLFRLFALRFFVISRCVISLFRLFAWRYFVILRGVISWQKDEMAQISHHVTSRR